jgi:L-lactate dehydrogenase (cytochrome)
MSEVPLATAAEFREAARRRLPRFLFDYIDGAAYDELTCRRNVADLGAVQLRQRVLRDVSAVDTSTDLLGESWAMPVALGPVGLSGMYARRGEAQAKRIASERGIPMCLSTLSLCSLEEVAAASERPPWFQLYIMRDRRFLQDLVDRAEAAHCSTLVLTVDMPVPGARSRDARSGMSGPNSAASRLLQAATHPGWAWDVGLLGRPHRLGNLEPLLGAQSHIKDYMGWIARNFDPSVTWREVDELRRRWSGRLVLKGILDADDAREALNHGIDGIVVSNHGGRQLDGVPSTAAALPAIAAAVSGRMAVLVDGGVRSGLDVVRMLALGAQGVLLGRAWAYALGAAGGAGVSRLLQIMDAEIRVAMALGGVTRVEQIDQSLLAS